MDAFQFAYESKSFDLTYHNGVWVLFSDEEIKELAKEQARITKHRIIATVHNAHNQSFQEYFQRMAQTDPLYQIRFFHVAEMKEILSDVSSKVTIIPVGKGKMRYEDKLIKRGFGHPTLLRTYFKWHGMSLLEQSERLLCIAEV
jgi:hypothetical protein